MSAGRRRAEVPNRASRPLAGLLLVGAVTAAAAWVALVVLAVRLGQTSRWALAVAVTLAAVGCLLVVFELLRRLWAALHGHLTPRATGRRRH